MKILTIAQVGYAASGGRTSKTSEIMKGDAKATTSLKRFFRTQQRQPTVSRARKALTEAMMSATSSLYTYVSITSTAFLGWIEHGRALTKKNRNEILQRIIVVNI